MSRHKLRIASIVGLITPVASGLAYESFSPLNDLLSKKYDVTWFSYRVDNPRLTSIRKMLVFMSLTWLPKLLLHLVKGRFDLFITCAIGTPEIVVTFIVSRLLKKPLIITDEHWYWRNTVPMKLLWPVARLIARKTSILLVSGVRSERFWRLSGVPGEKIRVAHFDVSIIKPDERHITLSKNLREVLGGNRRIVIYFGRLIKRKGADLLIGAFAKLSKKEKNVVLLIAGEGVERGNLQRLCKELRLNYKVYFTGYISQRDKATYFLACDVFVCPSVTMEMPEIWGLVVNEAMSVGKPVIVTTAVGCAPDLVKNGINGYIVPEKNVDALCDALEKVLANEETIYRMGRASRSIISGAFTYKHALEKLSESIELTYQKHSRKSVFKQQHD